MKQYNVLSVLNKLGVSYEYVAGVNNFFCKPSSLFNSDESSIVFCTKEYISSLLDKCIAAVVVIPKDVEIMFNKKISYVQVDKPREVFIDILNLCFPSRRHNGIHPTSVINDCVEFGRNVVVYPYCVIGYEGFGFYNDVVGGLKNFPCHGKTILGDNVEVFSFVNIDRGTLDDTVIEENTKIDHHCHIAHNVQIGRNCIITAGTVIGGSSKIGDNVYIGINSTIRNWIKIGDNVTIGMGSVVTKDIKDGLTVYGNPATFHPHIKKTNNDKKTKDILK